MQTTPYSVWRAPSGAAVVSMPEQINHANCARVQVALMRAVRSGAAVVIADLTRTGFCGYAGTDTLVSAHAMAVAAGARLRVAAASPVARLIRQVAGAGQRLELYPDLTTALAGPRSHNRAGAKTGTGHRLRLIPGGAARRSPGTRARWLSVVPPPGQAPPPRPPRDPA